MKKKEYTNSLIHESSPYLRQHAHNPIDWLPWREDTLQEGLRKDKPIFLSIGYSTCHWCHVMERESFSSEEVAGLLNESFICIKVDREEYPEVDAQYMEFAQVLLKSSLGWPLNLFLTPDRKPFFAMTYLPLEPKMGLSGFLEVLKTIKSYWEGEQREQLELRAETLVQAFRKQVHTQGKSLPSKEILKKAEGAILHLVDPIFGGLQGTPKFYSPHLYKFLLLCAIEESDPRPAFIVMRTLDKLQQGGIFDHLAGGFGRYSTDEEWKVPHFEKTLPSNALLAECFLEAWQATGQIRYCHTAEKTIAFLQKEFYQEGKGFLSAMDAETDGEEGKYYVWRKDEVKNVLQEQAESFLDFYSFDKSPFFQDAYVLHQEKSLEEYAREKGIDPEKFSSYLDSCRNRLLEERKKREKPFIDKKIITSWNGAAIHLFTLAAMSLPNPDLLQIAIKATEFILQNLWQEKYLGHSWMEGHVTSSTFDDYAFMVRALLTLFEATSSLRYLHWAKHFTMILEKEFKADNGAFYQTDKERNMLVQRCVFADGSEPSGNSVHCQNLLRLYQLTFETSYLHQAEDILRAAEPFFAAHPHAYAFSLMNVFRYYDVNAPFFIVVLNERQECKKELELLLWRSFIPNKIILFMEEGDEQLLKLLPVITQYCCREGKTTLYICQRGRCQTPLTDLVEIEAVIKRLEKTIIHLQD